MAAIDDLIKALTLVAPYMQDVTSPTHCEHDSLYLCVEPEKLPEHILETLDALGFHEDFEFGYTLVSGRFGSA